MEINGSTKIIGRLHTKNSERGLNIYNPYFQNNSFNYIYTLFTNNSIDKLISGVRNLNLAGAITVGFELDPKLPTLLDELSPVSKVINRVGYIVNRDGKLYGSYQGGEALVSAILDKYSLERKEITIVGAGILAKAFLFTLKESGLLSSKVNIVNRSVDNAKEMIKLLDVEADVYGLHELSKVSSDIIINITDIGGSVDDTVYTEDVVNKFECIVDVTFEKENTNLVELGKKSGKVVVTGWDMFTHQGVVALQDITGKDIDPSELKEYVVRGLSTVV